MFSSNNKISVRQIQVLIFISGFASCFTVLPRFLANTGGNSGFIIIALTSIIVSLFVAFCLNAFEKSKKGNFKNIVESLFGKYLGNIIYFLMTIKILVSGGLMLRILCEVIRETTLFKTHISLTGGIIIILCLYSLKGGIEGFGRLGEIIFITAFIPILIIFAPAVTDTDYTNILPIIDVKNQNIVQGFIVSLCIFFGIENIFMEYSFVNKIKNIKNVRSIVISILFLGICSSIVYFFTITRFGAETASSKLFPVIIMLDTVEIPGAFIERQFIFVIWAVIASAFVFINSAFIFGMTFNKNKFFKIIYSIIIFTFCFIPSNITKTLQWFYIVNIFGGIVFGVLLPFILAIYCIIDRRKEH